MQPRIQTPVDPTATAEPPVPSTAAGRARRHVPQWLRLFVGTPLTVVGIVAFGVIALAAVLGPILTPYQPLDMIGPLHSPPTGAHLFGTNDVGQDLFTQAVYGARYSLAVGLGSGVAITVLATILGMTAGYVGRWVDDVLSMIMNVFLVMPQLPLLVVIAAYIPFKGGDPTGAAVVMIAVITITGWAWGARVIRSQTLTLRNRDFVQAAMVAGEPTWRIIFQEVMPNMISLLANTVIMSSMGAILAEAALDYLGIGSINQVTWGTMLNKAQANSTLFSGEWWCFVFPGLAIAVTAMSLILMNYGIDLVSNPRLRIIKDRSSIAGRARLIPFMPGGHHRPRGLKRGSES
ncbi:MAG TPA: ABC transporter permease [Chloroflexota bacterium]|nr:ABC transporter permease [Chloroflexota bacterium]